MKFIRNAKLREKILDFLSRALLIGLSILACLWMISGAHADQNSITGIKAEEQGDGSYVVDFSTSQRLTPEQVSIEFERNFIQLSLKGVSAYPARSEKIHHNILEKVFTYQYQPDLARARVLLKTAASAIRSKASWEITPTGIHIVVKDGASVTRAASDTLKNKAGAVGESSENVDSEEERIVEEILKESRGLKASAQAPLNSKNPNEEQSASVSNKNDSKSSPVSAEDQAIFGPKSNAENMKTKEGSAPRILGSLLFVIGMIGACAMAYKRFSFGKGMPFQRQPRVIETIASQTVGQKKSIALVKVLDQYLVLGMAGDGMSLLLNLGSDVKIEKYLDQMNGPSFMDAFEGALSSASSKIDSSDSQENGTFHKVPDAGLGIRGAIKKRIEGFKPL